MQRGWGPTSPRGASPSNPRTSLLPQVRGVEVALVHSVPPLFRPLRPPSAPPPLPPSPLPQALGVEEAQIDLEVALELALKVREGGAGPGEGGGGRIGGQGPGLVDAPSSLTLSSHSPPLRAGCGSTSWITMQYWWSTPRSLTSDMCPHLRTLWGSSDM